MEHASQTKGPQAQPASAALRTKSATITDHSPGGDRLRGLAQLMNASPAVQRLQSVSDNIQRKEPEEEELVQAKNSAPVQANRTGLPDNLKSGIESLSGLSMDHVQVHRNSSKPAQLNAHAFAQGSDIHLAPGQDQHLPHEAWHVVQQAQGRVKPTMQMKGGVQINDDAGLEREADVMGARALAAPLQLQIIPDPKVSRISDRVQQHQMQAVVDDVAHVKEPMDIPVTRSLVFRPNDSSAPVNMNDADVAQLDKEYVVADEKGSLVDLGDDDESDRKGWLFYELGDDFVWVKKDDRAQFEIEFSHAALLSGGADDVDEGPAEDVDFEEEKDVGSDTENPFLHMPFNSRPVLNLYIRQEGKGDHQYVIVIIAGGENLKIELGAGGHNIKRSEDISAGFGIPIAEYAPNEGLTAGAVVERFTSLSEIIEFDSNEYNCIRYANEFVSELGHKISEDEISDLFG